MINATQLRESVFNEKKKVFIDTKTEISSKVNGNMTKNTQGIIGIMMEVLFKANLVRDRCHME